MGLSAICQVYLRDAGIGTNGSELAPFNRRLVGNGASLLLPAGGGTQN